MHHGLTDREDGRLQLAQNPNLSCTVRYALAISALESENNAAGFELPIPCGALKPRIATPSLSGLIIIS
jgi:hypothetical protein